MLIVVKKLGLEHYHKVHKEMIKFTQLRSVKSYDQIWLVEHPSIFTQGLHGKPEHVISNTQGIPVFHSDRGGQVTYHAPGQAVIYFLFDLKRINTGIRYFVSLVEKSCIDLLGIYNIFGHTKSKAPGIYVKNSKISSLGFRVRRGKIYHGLSINVNMDLKPFSWINPCGYHGLEMTQICTYNNSVKITDVFNNYIKIFSKNLFLCLHRI